MLMIRAITLAAALLAPLAARAQPAQQAATPEQTALGQMVIEGAQREAGLRAQLIVAEGKLRAAEAAKATPPAEPAKQ